MPLTPKLDVQRAIALYDSGMSFLAIGRILGCGDPLIRYHVGKVREIKLQFLPRQQAKMSGEKYYMPTRPCVRGHLSKRLTQYGQCLACARLHRREARIRNPERCRELDRLSKQRNPERVKKNWDDWHAKNKEHMAAYQRANSAAVNERAARWRAAHPERWKEVRRRYTAGQKAKGWPKALRRLDAERKATPSWVDRKAIVAFYETAKRITLETGIPHHVDHIFPLQGKTSCGLHVPWNLQVISAELNIRKSNKLISVEKIDGKHPSSAAPVEHAKVAEGSRAA